LGNEKVERKRVPDLEFIGFLSIRFLSRVHDLASPGGQLGDFVIVKPAGRFLRFKRGEL
jgi:hypothetical protein